MSATNAISGISLVGSIVIAGGTGPHQQGRDDPRFHRRSLFDDQRRRRVRDHGPMLRMFKRKK
jgi:hypothetical protein